MSTKIISFYMPPFSNTLHDIHPFGCRRSRKLVSREINTANLWHDWFTWSEIEKCAFAGKFSQACFLMLSCHLYFGNRLDQTCLLVDFLSPFLIWDSQFHPSLKLLKLILHLTHMNEASYPLILQDLGSLWFFLKLLTSSYWDARWGRRLLYVVKCWALLPGDASYRCLP